jgi:hypothetical protein
MVSAGQWTICGRRRGGEQENRPVSAKEATIKRLKQLRADANYGKKRQFNAAKRKDACHNGLGVPVVILTIIIGAGFFATLREDFPDIMKYIGGGLGLLSALLAGLQTYFRFMAVAEGHRRIGTRYLAVAKKCSNVIAYCEDGMCRGEQLQAELDKLTGEYLSVAEDARAFPTSAQDYRSTRNGIRDGEEVYTEQELEL